MNSPFYPCNLNFLAPHNKHACMTFLHENRFYCPSGSNTLYIGPMPIKICIIRYRANIFRVQQVKDIEDLSPLPRVSFLSATSYF